VSFYIEILGLTGALPCIVSVCLAMGCLNPKSDKAPALRHAGAFAFALAFFVAWFSLPCIPWTVKSTWQWLPWLMLITALIFSIAESANSRWTEWFAVVVAMASVCAFAVVPDWDDMEPTRPLAVAVVVTTAVLLVVACQHLTRRMHPGALTGLLMLCGFGSCILLGLAGSLKFAQLAGAMTAATTGCLLVSCKTSDRSAIRTLLPAFLVAMTCLIYTGYANSFAGISPVAFLLVAVALSAANLSMIPGLNTTAGYKRYKHMLLPFVFVSIPLVIGILIALRSSPAN
jgi:hypothetical protein